MIRVTLGLLVLAILLSATPYPTPLRATNTVPDAQEYAALVALYQATDGDQWTDRTDWLQGNTIEDIATWYGVTVADGDVVALDLSRNKLTGELPPELGNLTALAYLNLSANQLTTLPPTIGQLTALVSLTLNDNNLTSLPDGIGGLSSLEYLNLNYNNLSALPPTVGQLTELVSLYLYANQLTTLPASVGQMSSLETLFLFRNPLASLPAEIAQAPRFRGLFAQETTLQSLPETLGQVATLEFLNVSDSQLDSLPPMDNPPKLRGVIATGNRLRVIPDFSDHPNRANLTYKVENNALDLNYIAQHLTGPDSYALKNFVYRPQRPLDTEESIPGPTINPFPLQHPQSRYQWQRQSSGSWQDVAGATAPTYTVTEATTDRFRCRLTHPWLPEMVYYSAAYRVSEAGPPPAPQWQEAECATVGSNWQAVEDPQAAGGQYLVYPSGNRGSAPSTSPADHVAFSVDVTTAGQYNLLARVQTPTRADDSFWVRINDGEWLQWTGGVYAPDWTWRQLMRQRHALRAGSNTITFAHREDGARLDKLFVTLDASQPRGTGEADPGCVANPVTYWLEAECATAGSSWQTAESSAAAGGKYLSAPGKNSRSSAPTSPEAHLVFAVDVSEAGDYRLLGRINAPSSGGNSLWYRVDGGPWVQWGEGIATGQGFGWNVAPDLLSLAAGAHTLTVAYREGATQLDKLALSTDNQLPGGLGEIVPCGGGGELPEEVPGEPLAFRAQWGGNVSGMVWSSFHYEQPVYQQAYTYRYDQVSRLTEARYASQDDTGGWTAHQSDYSVQDLTYDRNGNLTGLTRYTADPVATEQGPVSVRRLMDQLSYRYQGNRLQAVSDVADAQLGFVDGASSGNEYGYDANGNLTRDDNKGITNVTYDPVLDVPLRVDFADGARINYTYDAAGNRLAQTTTLPDGSSSTTDYVGAVEYRDDALSLIHHPEGRVVPKTGPGTGGSFVYHYDLRDHLGNVRLTFSEEPMVASSQATMEASAAPREEAWFEDVATARRVLAYHNTTPASAQEANPNKVATLLPGQTGPAKSLSVRQGDVVHLQVNAAYETSRGQVQGLEGIATQVAGAAARTAGGLESTTASPGTNPATLGSAVGNSNPDKAPPAHLNYLVYNTDYQLVDQGFVAVSEAAAVPVGSTDNSPAETLALDVDIEQNGFLYAYLSNGTASSTAAGVPVNFDDFEVDHTGISIVQHNDYYAFGATYQQSADRVLNNRYLYQGKELQDEAGLELYDFHARQYDPLLGRFTSLDPQNQFASGYVGMGNNPVNMIDPDGQFAGALVGKFVSGVANAMFGSALMGAEAAHQSGGQWWVGAAQGALGAGITATLGAFAPPGALGAVYNAGVSALAGSAINGSFSGFGQSALASLPGAFVGGAVGNIDQSITASREQALTNSWSPPKGDYILLPEVTFQDARRGSFFAGWGNAHRWLHSNPTMRSLHGASGFWNLMEGPGPSLIKGGNGFPDIEVPSYIGGTAPAPGVRTARFPFKTTKHFLNRITQRISRGITPQKAIDAYNKGRVYYNPATKNYIRHSSSTKVSVVTNRLKGGKAITVFEGNPSPDWVPIKWRP